MPIPGRQECHIPFVENATTTNPSSNLRKVLPSPSPIQIPHRTPAPATTPKLPPSPLTSKPQTFLLLCEILSTTPIDSIEKVLADTGVHLSTEDVENVLKLSYYSGAAVRFFLWASLHVSDNYSPYSLDFVIDLLGKNYLFDAMWNATKSMHAKNLLSLATFVSVSSSYAATGRVDEAVMAFEVMDQCGCPRDVARPQFAPQRHLPGWQDGQGVGVLAAGGEEDPPGRGHVRHFAGRMGERRGRAGCEADSWGDAGSDWVGPVECDGS